MSGFVGAIIVGIVCIILGITNMRGNISTLHSYHRNRVSEENILPFGRLVGLGTIIIGISIVICGVFSILSLHLEKQIFLTVGMVLMGLGIVVGIVISFYAMKKYNGGIF